MATLDKEIEESPIAWFYELEAARRRNDLERAAKAKRELERLGVFIRYTPPNQRRARVNESS